jgi:hypothetical protein
MNTKSIIIGILAGLIFGCALGYAVLHEKPLRSTQKVDIIKHCTIQITYLEDGWKVYKTVVNYPVYVYEIETSRYGIVTYKGYAANSYVNVDKNACIR